MAASEIILIPLTQSRRETFIRELQAAFSEAVVETYGP